jgi:hypothetical protein
MASSRAELEAFARRSSRAEILSEAKGLAERGISLTPGPFSREIFQMHHYQNAGFYAALPNPQKFSTVLVIRVSGPPDPVAPKRK